MALSNARAYYGLTADGQATRTNVSGVVVVGVAPTTERFGTSNEGFSNRVILANSGDIYAVDIGTGDTTGSTAWTAGTAQVETATIVAASGCTSNGTMTLVLTTNVLGSPLNIDVALTTATHTTAALIAAAARAAITANATLAALDPVAFTVGGTGADIVITRTPAQTFTVGTESVPIYIANDATLNLAIPSGLGVTAAASSTNTTAGVATDGAKIFDDGLNFEGKPITPFSQKAILIDGAGAVLTYTAGSNQESIAGQILKINSHAPSAGFVFTASGAADFTLTVVGDL